MKTGSSFRPIDTARLRLRSAVSPGTGGRIKRLAEFTSVQVLVQLLTVASGFLVVRSLQPREFAFYTIALSMQTTMDLLANMGIAAGVSAIGGEVWQDRTRFGELITTALSLRHQLALGAVAVVLPILVFLLLHNGALLSGTCLVCLVVLTTLFFQLKTMVLIIVLRLHSQLRRIQQIDLSAAVLRLLLLITVCFFYPRAAVVLAIAGIVALAQLMLLRNWAGEKADLTCKADSSDRARLTLLIKQGAPNTIFYCLQGQIVVWLISLYGNTKNVAEVGALGRLAVIYSVLGAVMTSVFMPYFSRCREPSLMLRRYFETILLYVAIGIALITFAYIFPGSLLWVLGKNYVSLRREVVLMMIAAASNSVVVAMWSLNSARGWIKWGWLNIPATLIMQALMLPFLELSTVSGVLIFSIFSTVPNVLVNCLLSYQGFRDVLKQQRAVVCA